MRHNRVATRFQRERREIALRNLLDRLPEMQHQAVTIDAKAPEGKARKARAEARVKRAETEISTLEKRCPAQ
jgi:hypothetical protein